MANPNPPILFSLLQPWRWGRLRVKPGGDLEARVRVLEEALGSVDRSGESLERHLERQTKILNYGMIAGACKDVAVRVSGIATDSTTINSTTATDLTNVTVTFTPDTDVRVLVVGTYDVQMSVVAGGSVFVGTLDVDGSAQAAQAIINLNGAVANSIRATCAQHWALTLTGKVSHTLKLRGAINVAGGTYVCNGLHTGFTYHTFPIAPF